MRINNLVMTCTCGAAPVQYEGTCGTWEWYFRARWDRWQFGIGATPEDAVNITIWNNLPGVLLSAGYGVRRECDASMMPYEEADRLIMECLEQIDESILAEVA